MFIGADYYPEHWPESRWPLDAQLMREAAFNVVRLAEFAWSLMEPEEGRFEFAWLDRALAILRKNGIRAILGTPTGSMPAWVAHRYPEVVGTQSNGQKIPYGVRKDNCVCSGTYRLLSQRITRAMAGHYATHPAVIGWQTDNEFGDPYCYCEVCRRSFHDWLRARYRTLDALNRAWGTQFWCHLYRTWDEVPLPRRGEGSGSCNNPSMDLDFKRFYSQRTVEFQREQVQILRQLCPNQFVTHNFMGFFPNINYYDLAADLDFVAWDNYPVWGDPEVPRGAAAAADLMRGLKRKNFWIMEMTAGPGGWGVFGRNARPGEIRRIAFQQVAHGADGILWFRWRTCRSGREQYWHGLLGHDGVPARRYREAAQTAKDLRRIEREIEGATVPAQVAFLYDYDSLWALAVQPGFGDNSYQSHLQRYHHALQRLGVQADIVSPAGDLSKYKVVIAPQLFVMPDGIAKKLVEFVRTGGVLLTDLRSAVKDETNLCHERVLPGLLAKPLGIRIEEYESLGANTKPSLIASADLAGSFTAKLYADWVIPMGAEVLFRFGEAYLAPYAAATRNKFARGWAYYVGTIAEEPAFYDAIVGDVLARAKVKALVAPPAGVEAGLRVKKGARFVFLINHNASPATVALPKPATDLVTGSRVGRSLVLEANGVAVLRL